MDCTVSADFGVTVDPDEADVRNEQAWADLSVRMNVDVRHHRKQLVDDAKYHSGGHPKPSGPALADHFVKSMNCERPKSFRSPTAVSVLPETRQIGPTGSPLAIPGPIFDCISIVLQWTSSPIDKRQFNRTV